MKIAQARDILNRARGGENISAGLISAALRVTGDIGSLDPVQIRTQVGHWELEAEASAMCPAGPFDWLAGIAT